MVGMNPGRESALRVTAVILAAGCLAAGRGCGSGDGGAAVAPQLSWATPSAIVYGTALGAAQLNATASVPGTFQYSPAAGTVLAAGSHTLTATFTPTDARAYTTASITVTQQVDKATPSIAWPPPSSVPVGTLLSPAQLNAAVKGVDGKELPGAAAYTPAAGTVLSTPGPVSLSLSFAPADAANYTTVTAGATVWVLAPLTA